MLVIKAGGSVITRKGPGPVFDRAGAARLAGVLSRLKEPFILVHGTGSFGKPPAARYRYLSGRIAPGAAPVAAIKASLLDLHSSLVSELVAGGVKAVSCPGCAFFSLVSGRPRLKAGQVLLEWLRGGFVPVINSDIFTCSSGGFRVVSSDALLQELSAELEPALAVFFTDTPGLLSRGGVLLPRLEHPALLRLKRQLPRSPADVSGGMRGKIAEIIRISSAGVDAVILDGRRPAELLELRAGRRAKGTYIHASKK